MLKAIRNLNYLRSKDHLLYQAISDVISKARQSSEKISLGTRQEFFGLPVDHPLAAGDLDAVQVSHNFAVANTPYTIPHNLGRVPTGYVVVVVAAPVAATIYNGNASHWTDSTIELESTAAVTVRMLVF